MSMRSAKQAPVPTATADADFKLPSTKRVHVDGDVEKYRKALSEYDAAVDAVDARDVLRRIDADGKLRGDGTDGMRLTDRAFSSLCSIAKVPEPFIRRLARADMDQALDVLQTAIDWSVQSSATQIAMIVDTRNGYINEMTTAHTQAPSLLQCLDGVLAIRKGKVSEVDFRSGAIDGPDMRFKLLDWTRTTEVKKGDVVNFGVTGSSEMGVKRADMGVFAYAEHLVCTNGMVDHRANGGRMIHHAEATPEKLFELGAHASAANKHMGDLISMAAKHELDQASTDKMYAYLANSRNGGNERIAKRAFEIAPSYAEDDRLTVWNVADGVTRQAHAEVNPLNATRYERLGYASMRLFAGKPEKQN